MVMPVGAAVGQVIDTAGFVVSDCVRLLGLDIKNVNTDFDDCFKAIHSKI
jgi:hypothetical protein